MELDIMKQKYKKQNYEIVRINTIYAAKLRNYELRHNKLLQTNIDLNMKLNKVKKLIKNCLSHYYEFKNEIYIENSQKVFLEKIFNILYNIIITIDNKKNINHKMKDRASSKNHIKESNPFNLNTITDVNEYIESNDKLNYSDSVNLDKYTMESNTLNDIHSTLSNKKNLNNNLYDTPQKKSYYINKYHESNRKNEIISEPLKERKENLRSSSSPSLPFSLISNSFSTINSNNDSLKSSLALAKKRDNGKYINSRRKEFYIRNADDIPIVVKKEDLDFSTTSISNPTSIISSPPPLSPSSLSSSSSPLTLSPSLPQLVSSFSFQANSINDKDNDILNAKKRENEVFEKIDSYNKKSRYSFVIDTTENNNYNKNKDHNIDDDDTFSLCSLSSDDSKCGSDIFNRDLDNSYSNNNNNIDFSSVDKVNNIHHNFKDSEIDNNYTKDNIIEDNVNINKKNNKDTESEVDGYYKKNNNNNTSKKKKNKSSNGDKINYDENYNRDKKDDDDDYCNTISNDENDNNDININTIAKNHNSKNNITTRSNITIKKYKTTKPKKDIDIKTISMTLESTQNNNNNNKSSSSNIAVSPYQSPLHHVANKENINPNRRSHRHKNIVNYALPSIRSKLRRGDKDYGCGIIRPLNNPYGIKTFSHKKEKN